MKDTQNVTIIGLTLSGGTAAWTGAVAVTGNTATQLAYNNGNWAAISFQQQLTALIIGAGIGGLSTVPTAYLSSLEQATAQAESNAAFVNALGRYIADMSPEEQDASLNEIESEIQWYNSTAALISGGMFTYDNFIDPEFQDFINEIINEILENEKQETNPCD